MESERRMLLRLSQSVGGHEARTPDPHRKRVKLMSGYFFFVTTAAAMQDSYSNLRYPACCSFLIRILLMMANIFILISLKFHHALWKRVPLMAPVAIAAIP